MSNANAPGALLIAPSTLISGQAQVWVGGNIVPFERATINAGVAHGSPPRFDLVALVNDFFRIASMIDDFWPAEHRQRRGEAYRVRIHRPSPDDPALRSDDFTIEVDVVQAQPRYGGAP